MNAIAAGIVGWIFDFLAKILALEGKAGIDINEAALLKDVIFDLGVKAYGGATAGGRTATRISDAMAAAKIKGSQIHEVRRAIFAHFGNTARAKDSAAKRDAYLAAEGKAKAEQKPPPGIKIHQDGTTTMTTGGAVAVPTWAIGVAAAVLVLLMARR